MAFLDPPDAAAKRRQYRIAAGAVLATTTIAVLFSIESRFGYLPRDPQLIYFQSWSANRSEADMAADRKATLAAREARLAKARAYVASLSGKAREDAQKQLDDYVKGGMLAKDIPYVAAVDRVRPDVAVPGVNVPAVNVPAEPPVR